MKYVLLYGPPAAGKLTVAQILARRTGLLLIHKNMIVDFVEPLFPRGTPGYNRLICKVRLATLEDPFQLVDGRSSLIIDSGVTDPETAVVKIIRHYNLMEIA